MNKLVSNHLTDTHWREIFLLVAGLKGSADSLLLQMEKQAQRYLNTPKLQGLIQWTDEATAGSKGAYKSAAKRAAAAYLALTLDLTLDINRALALIQDQDQDPDINLDLVLVSNLKLVRDGTRNVVRNRALDLVRDLILDRDLDRDLSLDRDLVRNLVGIRDHDLILSLDRDLNRARQFNQLNIFKTSNLNALIGRLEALKTQIPDKTAPQVDRLAFVTRMYKTWINALQINPDLVKLSWKEGNDLTEFLAANHLIIQCKTAAVRVSRQVWEGIEERMLTISKDNQSCKS